MFRKRLQKLLRRPLRAALVLPATFAAAVAADLPHVEHLDSGTVLPAGLPFSEAVRVGDTLYLSGQIGVKPGTLEIVDGGMAAQARQTLDNVKAILAAHGYAMSDVVKCTVMLLDMNEWAAFNDIYVSYFSPPYPARSAFGASGLAAGARLELECMAVAGD